MFGKNTERTKVIIIIKLNHLTTTQFGSLQLIQYLVHY